MCKIGFVGLGIMGAPMSLNLLKNKEHILFVHDTNPQTVKKIVAHGAKAAQPAEIASKCDIVFLILPNGAVVRDVLFAGNGIARHMRKGSIVVDMSSVMPHDSIFCAQALAEYGVAFVDAPVSGGEPKAVDGTLAFMVGGAEQDFNRVYPLLLNMGASAVLVGKSGCGSIAKLVNQIIVNLTIAAVSEAFVFGVKAGAAPEKVYQAIRDGLAGSAVLDAKIPLILERNFIPGGKISINHKDIGNVLSTAHEIDSPVPLTSQLFEIFQTMKAHGYMDLDHGFLVHYFEDLSGITVGCGSEKGQAN